MKKEKLQQRSTKDHKRLRQAANYVPKKMDNLEDTDKFLQKYNLTRLNQGEIENMKKQITRTEIETVIESLPTEAQGQRVSQVNSTKMFKKS